MASRLQDSASPYLRQHADNPVDWWPWCPEAFEEAERRDVPVFLSIGYSTCHWCHVMAHESFEDPEIAKLLNDAFVCIKVDREERPDVDDLYMQACLAQNGSGGWPLTVIAAPDKTPLWTATYIPPRARGQHPGLEGLVPRIQQTWKDKGDEWHAQGRQVFEHLTAPPTDHHERLELAWADQVRAGLRDRFDPEQPGFGAAPRFPSPHVLVHLLQTGGDEEVRMVRETLHAMADGGIHDHVGGGFHRYSTDRNWHLPHFEKMLYDQAMLLMAYADGFAATGEERFRDVAAGIVAYLQRDLGTKDGTFYSAEDADSEGEEGTFYVWDHGQVQDILQGDADWFSGAFQVKPEGNFHDEATGQQTGKNILHLQRDARAAILADPGETKRMDNCLRRLRGARNKRPRPHLDDKVLTDWNGLIAAALAHAGRRCGHTDWTRAAGNVLERTLARRRDDGLLDHLDRPGPAFLDDQAYMLWALLEMFEATQEAPWLQAAVDLAAASAALRAERGYVSSIDSDVPGVRTQAADGALPAGNSILAWCFAHLHRITGDAEWGDRADHILQGFAADAKRYPTAYVSLATAYQERNHPGPTVVLVGDDPRLQEAAQSSDALVLRPTDSVAELAPWLQEYQTRGPAAFVCRDFACQRPTSDAKELQTQLA